MFFSYQIIDFNLFFFSVRVLDRPCFVSCIIFFLIELLTFLMFFSVKISIVFCVFIKKDFFKLKESILFKLLTFFVFLGQNIDRLNCLFYQKMYLFIKLLLFFPVIKLLFFYQIIDYFFMFSVHPLFNI